MPRNGLPYHNAEALSNVAIHLVYQKKHGNIYLQVEAFLPFGNAVKARRIAPAEVNGHHVTMIFNALGDESLLPWYIMNMTVYDARIQPCRKHQHVVIALEPRLYHTREIASLPACLVNTYTDGLQTGEEEQQIVHQVAETPPIMAPDDGTKAYPVLPAQRMI